LENLNSIHYEIQGTIHNGLVTVLLIDNKQYEVNTKQFKEYLETFNINSKKKVKNV
jgi:hypothetical protein